MKDIYGDSSVSGSTGQFKGEQNVREFRACVSPQREPEVQGIEGVVIISVESGTSVRF